MKYSFKGSKQWLPHVGNSTTYYIYLLMILALSLYCIQKLLVLVALLQSFLIFQLACSLSTHSFSATPIKLTEHPEWCNFVNYIYNTYMYRQTLNYGNQMSPKKLQKSILLYKFAQTLSMIHMHYILQIILNISKIFSAEMKFMVELLCYTCTSVLLSITQGWSERKYTPI